MHMVPKSCQSEDNYQSCSCCSDLDLILCCHNCTASSDFSEQVLIDDYFSAVDTNMAVVDTELLQHTDTDNMA